jgi:hypothetical protein
VVEWEIERDKSDIVERLKPNFGPKAAG